MIYDPRPMSIPERRALVDKLRCEALEKTKEADRIEAGIEADEAEFVALIMKSARKKKGE